MAMVKASLMLFGGDTLVVRCSERCHIHLMSAKAAGDSHADILSVQDRDSAYLTAFALNHYRAFQPWKDEELRRLKAEAAQGMSLGAIAKAHERPQESVAAKLRELKVKTRF